MTYLKYILFTMTLTLLLSGCGSTSSSLPIVQEEPEKEFFKSGDEQNILEGKKVPLKADILNDKKKFLHYTWRENNKIIGTEEKLYTDSLSAGIHNITLEVIDEEGNTYTDIIKVTIKKIDEHNTAPVANSNSFILTEDSTYTTTLHGSDIDGDKLSYLLVSPPSHGKLSGSFTNLHYAPEKNYFGEDSFEFKLYDGKIDSNIAKISIKIQAVNDAPVANNTTISTINDTDVNITLSATDLEGDAITYTLATQPLHGSLFNISNNTMTYHPDSNVETDSFTFFVNDGNLSSAIATVHINIIDQSTPIKASPVLTNLSHITATTVININTSVKWEGDDVTLTNVALTNGTKGHVTFTQNGMVHFTPTWYFENLLYDSEINATLLYTIKDRYNNETNSTITVPIKSTKIIKPFILTYATDMNKTIKVPVKSAYGLFKIDWGDGSVITYHDDTNITTHTYQDASASHQIKLYGISHIDYWNARWVNDNLTETQKKQLLSINQWGDTKWSTMSEAFLGCRNLELTATDRPDLSQVSTTMNMFANTAINTNINNWDVSQVTNMQQMFMNATSFNQPLDTWDVSNVNTMQQLLSNTSFSTQNYNELLNAWSQLSLQNNVQFGLPLTLRYEDIQSHDKLINDFHWIITDGGLTDAKLIETSFITTWETTTGDNNITIYTNPAFTGMYNYTVIWGDSEESLDITGNTSHTYTTEGNHTVKIHGEFPAIYQHDTDIENAKQLLSVNHWGKQKWQSMEASFRLCENLEINATDIPDLSQVTNMSHIFHNAIHFNSNIKEWNVSNVKNMDYMFYNAKNFNKSINDWNVSSVTSMQYMFDNTYHFDRNISSWNVSHVTDMRGMFWGSAFNQDISHWDVSNVTNMKYMFQGSEFNQNINHWDVSNVTAMKYMFFKATSFNQDISSWDISNVNDMQHFLSDTIFSTLNYNKLLQEWSQLVLQEGIVFDAPSALTYTDADAHDKLVDNFHWTITDGGLDATITDQIAFITTWKTTSNNENITIGTRDREYYYNYTIDWGDGSKDNYIDGNSTHTYTALGEYIVKITGVFPAIHNANSSFGRENARKLISIKQWGNQRWKTMNHAFGHCSNLQDTNKITAPDLMQVTSMRNMFHASSFNQEVNDWDVSHVTDMEGLFESTTDFNQELNNWDVSHVTDMDILFRNAGAFDKPLDAWDMSGVRDVQYMFSLSVFNQDISGWDLSNVDSSGLTMLENSSIENSYKPTLP